LSVLDNGVVDYRRCQTALGSQHLLYPKVL